MSPPAIPDHTLLRPIGRGAYGEVWLARNVMGALRAIKVIWRRQFESQRPYDREFAGMQRFEPLSRSSGGLVHVLHVGRNDAEGYFYYVMELADADDSSASASMEVGTDRGAAPGTARNAFPLTYSPRTLRSDLKRLGLLSTADCVRLALEVVGGLAELHRHGLVHRDVKPGNIIYVNGRAKLADIGLVSGGGEGRTFVGTEGYIPPEGPGTPAADLYALGIALYEASTGNPPEKFPDVPVQWLAEDAENGELEFHEIVLKACEGQRERRYQTADAMQADVALLQSGQSLRRARTLERRYAAFRLGGITGAALLVCALGTAFFANYRARLATASRAKETLLREQAQHSLARAETAEHGSRQQLYTALLGEARATVLSRELGQRVRALEAVRRAASISNTAELRGAAVAALALPDLRFDKELPTTPDMTLLCLDPAFTRIALCSGRGPVEIRSVADNSLVSSLPASTNLPAYMGLWSPDGRFLAIARDYDSTGKLRDVEIWEIAHARRTAVFKGTPGAAIAFHPKLPRVIVGEAPATALIWDLETCKEIGREGLLGTPMRLKFAPEGERFAELYFTNREWVAAVRRVKDGGVEASQAFTNTVRDFNWDPSGRWLALPDYGGAVNLMDTHTGETRLLGRHRAEATVAEFRPNGGYLFSGGWDRELICWDLKSMQRALTINLDSYHAQFSGNGHRCAILRWPEIRLQLHAFELPMLHREFSEDLGGRRNSAAFSRDGRWLAVSGGDAMAVWDLSGTAPGAMAGEAGESRVVFAPNGEVFAHHWQRCFRWRPRPGADAMAAPNLEPLEINKPDSFESLSPTSLGVVLTSRQGSRVTAYDRLAADTNSHVRTEWGVNRASPDERWLGIHRAFMPYLEIYRLPGLEHVASLTNHAAISTFEFSPAGDEVAVASRAGVEFWSTANWQRLRYLTNFTDILYSADARTLWLSTGMRSAGLYDAPTLNPILPLPFGTLPLACSPDGRYLAVRADVRRVELWDMVEVRKRLQELGLDWSP